MEFYSERMIKGRAEAVKTIVEVDDTDAWVHGHVYRDVLVTCTAAVVRFRDQGALKSVTSETEAYPAAAQKADTHVHHVPVKSWVCGGSETPAVFRPDQAGNHPVDGGNIRVPRPRLRLEEQDSPYTRIISHEDEE